MFKVNFFQFLMGKRCRSCSICDYCLGARSQRLWQMISDFSPCSYELFPLIFWLVFGLSCAGVLRSIWECVYTYSYSRKCIALWRDRKFHVLSANFMRHGRLVGAIVSSYTWAMMLYALINITPCYMMPWLLLNTLALFVDFILWLIELMPGRLIVQLRGLLPISRLACTLALVNCVRKVFENAVQHNRVESLALMTGVSVLRGPF
ncbi:hypothetical protein KR222_010307 [Zaprionus bogoriensis]|nr:hypothetical protein KR222_010307 [Zaprionus bogoriensis]